MGITKTELDGKPLSTATRSQDIKVGSLATYNTNACPGAIGSKTRAIRKQIENSRDI